MLTIVFKHSLYEQNTVMNGYSKISIAYDESDYVG